jgi:hypothetical protein
MNLFEYLHARATRNANIDLLIGRTQRSISTGTLWVIAGVLAALLFLEGVDAVVKDLLLLVLGALLGGWASQNQFWFGRPRGAGVPDPSLTETKTTETKTVETKTAPVIQATNPEGES